MRKPVLIPLLTALSSLTFLLSCQCSLSAENSSTELTAKLTNNAVALVENGHYEEANSLVQNILEQSRTSNGDTHPTTLSIMLLSGNLYLKLGQKREALESFRKAYLGYAKTLGEKDRNTITALGSLATYYQGERKYIEELELREKILKLRTETLGAKDPQTIESLAAVANVYSTLGQPELALPLQSKALAYSTEELGEKHVDTIQRMEERAYTIATLGQRDAANKTLIKALELRTALFGQKDPRTIFAAVRAFQQFSVNATVDETGAAVPIWEQMVNLSLEVLGKSSPVYLMALQQLGRSYMAAHRFDDSIKVSYALITINSQLFGAQHSATIAAQLGAATTLAIVGRTNDAFPLFEKVVNNVEALRNENAPPPEISSAMFSQWVKAYKFYASMLVGYHRDDEAFRIVELSKARTLLESAAIRDANQFSGLNIDDRAAVADYESRIEAINSRLVGEARESNARISLDVMKNKLFREYGKLRTELASRYPKYAQLNDVKILEVKEGQKILPDDAVFLSYLVNGDNVNVFVLSKEGNLFAKHLMRFPETKIGDDGTLTIGKFFPAIPNLSTTIETYRAVIAQPDGISGLRSNEGLRPWKLTDGSYSLGRIRPAPDALEVADVNEIANYLGQWLIEPIKKVIQGKRQWIISGDASLLSLPFEALIVDGKPLIADHDISYVQSLSMYGLLKQREKDYGAIANRKSLFAMGGANYEVEGKALDTDLVTEMRSKMQGMAFPNAYWARGSQVSRAFEERNIKWGNLPASKEEVRRVASQFQKADVTIVTGPDATEKRLIELNTQKELAQYRYLLFSTHGYLSLEDPSLSAVVLGQVDVAPGTDGFVTASEWPAYDLRSDLIALSGCDTGRGKVVDGEGVTGLPFSMFVAGNRNVLMTLWPVADESTSEFMQRFFAKLRTGMSHVTALSSTKREFLTSERYTSSAFWAPFILYGY